MNRPFLRIPPFPGHRAAPLAQAVDAGSSHQERALLDTEAVVAALRHWRVGSSFWGAPVDPGNGRDVVLFASDAAGLKTVIRTAREAGVIGRAVVAGRSAAGVPRVPADADPWSLCEKAALVIADGGHEAALVARLVGTELRVVGEGRFAALRDPNALHTVVRAELGEAWDYVDPLRGGPLAVEAAIAMLGKWRRLVASNRQIAAVYGVAKWKRVTSDALLWDGTGPVRHRRSGSHAIPPAAGTLVMAWMARTDAAGMARLTESGVTVGEIEDGMIRSTGLGANCVPPLSIVVDAAGPHFDPAQASELETILENENFGRALLERAARLRRTLVDAGISKYGQDSAATAQQAVPRGARRTVLVTGQVEDDRSVLRGGAGLDNLSLLQRARASERDAWIVFKPHPDVESGHRKGRIPDPLALELADEIDRTSSIAALLQRVDAVHVLTSLAGFEALMRGREVVTHGVPFYAGWGLTCDLGPVPARRTRRRSLDELVAATLILYPRYVDPVTRLPCEPELLVERIAEGRAHVHSPLILLRELQGRLKRWLQGRVGR